MKRLLSKIMIASMLVSSLASSFGPGSLGKVNKASAAEVVTSGTEPVTSNVPNVNEFLSLSSDQIKSGSIDTSILSMSSDGKWAVTDTNKNSVNTNVPILINTVTGTMEEINPDSTVRIFSKAISPDGKTLIWGALDTQNSYIYAYDIENRTFKRALTTESVSYPSTVVSATFYFSPDGSKVIYATGQKHFVIYDITTNTLKTIPMPAGETVYDSASFVWSADSSKVLFNARLKQIYGLYTYDGSAVTSVLAGVSDWQDDFFIPYTPATDNPYVIIRGKNAGNYPYVLYTYSFDNNTVTPVDHGISAENLKQIMYPGSSSSKRGLQGAFVINNGTQFVMTTASSSPPLRNAIIDIRSGKYVTLDNTSKVAENGTVGIHDIANHEYIFYNTDKVFSDFSAPRPTSISYSATPENVKINWPSTAGAENYEVFRNNQSIGSTADTHFIDSGAVRGQYTRYSVKAKYGENASSSRSITVDWKKSMLLGSNLVAPANTYVKIGGLTLRLIDDNTLIYLGSFDNIRWPNPQDGFLISDLRTTIDTKWYSKLTELEQQLVLKSIYTVPNMDQLNSSLDSIDHFFAPPSANDLLSYRKTYGVDLISGYSYLWVRDRGLTTAYYVQTSGSGPYLVKANGNPSQSTTFVIKLSSGADYTSIGSASTAGTLTNPWVVKSVGRPKPVTPNTFNATETTSKEVTLTWSSVAEADEYELKRNDIVVYTGGNLIYTDQPLKANTDYTYTLIARNASGASSPAILSAKTLPEPAVTPADFKVISKTADSVKLTWTGNDSDSYMIKRGEDVVYSNNGESFEDAGLEPSTNYVYTLVAKKGAAIGKPVTVSATTDQEVLDAVSDLVATHISYNSVDLKWNPVKKATSYTVYQDGSEIHRGTDLAFSATGLKEATEYSFKVEATKGAAVSPSATIIEKTKLEKDFAPVIDSVESAGLEAGGVGTDTVMISWTDVPDATSYKLTLGEEVIYEGAVKSFTAINLTSDKDYTFALQAVNVHGESNAVSITIHTLGVTPKAPTEFKTTEVLHDSVSLSWKDSVGAEKYEVYRDATLIYEGSQTAFKDVGLTYATDYHYTIAGVNVWGKSTVSDLNVTTAAEPAVTPTGFKLDSKTQTTIRLSWKSNGADTYEVKRDGVIVYSNISPFFEDSGLQDDTSHTYSLVARKGLLESEPAELTVKTDQYILTAPVNFKSNHVTYDSADLSWGFVDKATSYIVKQDGVVVHDGAEASTSITGLNEGTSYIFEVFALRGTIESPVVQLQVITKMENDFAPKITSAEAIKFKASNVEKNTVSISWLPVDGADSYTLMRDGAPVHHGAELSFTDDNVFPDISYDYSLYATNEHGNSNTVTISVHTQGEVPAVPTNFKVSRVSHDSASIQWSKVSGATRYELYRDDNVLVYEGPLTAFKDVTLAPTTSYHYTVSSVNKWGASTSVGLDLTTTAEPAVITISPTPPMEGTITFKFDVIEGAYEYHVERNPHWIYKSKGDGTYELTKENTTLGTFENLGVVTPIDGKLNFSEMDVTPGADYHYNIVAVKDNEVTGAPEVIGETEVVVTTPEDGSGVTVPGLEPTPEPTASPSPEPTATPTAAPTALPTISPAVPTDKPDPTPTPGPVVSPTTDPSAEPIPTPVVPSPTPVGPTVEPTEKPAEATPTPVVEPTNTPTEKPAEATPTPVVDEPTNAPTEKPVVEPIKEPNEEPVQPVEEPVVLPTDKPVESEPSQAPAEPTPSPEGVQTHYPSAFPGRPVVEEINSNRNSTVGTIVSEEVQQAPNLPITSRPPIVFDDQIPEYAKEAVRALVELGIVRGYQNNVFDADKSISRAEFAIMLYRAMGYPNAKVPSYTFFDFDSKAWYSTELAQALNVGITKGFTDNTYRPNVVIPREQAAVMLSNVIETSGIKPPITATSFTDEENIIKWAINSVRVVSSWEIIGGYPDGSFKPKEELNRGEAAIMIYNLLKAISKL